MGGMISAIPNVVKEVVGIIPNVARAIRGDKTNDVKRIQENKELSQALQTVERNRNNIDRLIENQTKLLQALMVLLQRLQEWEGMLQHHHSIFNQLANGYQQITNGTNQVNARGKIRIEMDLPDGAEDREEALQNFWRSIAAVANSQINSNGRQLALADKPWEDNEVRMSEKKWKSPQNPTSSLSLEEQSKIAIQFSLEEQEEADYRMALRLQKQDNNNHYQNAFRDARNFETGTSFKNHRYHKKPGRYGGPEHSEYGNQSVYSREDQFGSRFNTPNNFKEERQYYHLASCSHEKERGMQSFKHCEEFQMQTRYQHTNDRLILHGESREYGRRYDRTEYPTNASSPVPYEDYDGCTYKQDQWEHGATAAARDDQEERDYLLAQMLQEGERRVAKLNFSDTDDDDCGPGIRF